MARLFEIHKSLGTEYDITQVRASTFEGKAASLAVVVHVPLTTFENKTEKERIREEVFQKVATGFNDMERFGKLKIVISSGYNIGIAQLKKSD